MKKRTKYITIPIVFSIFSSIFLTLFLSLNYHFFKEDYFSKIDEIYLKVDSIIDKEGYFELDKYFQDSIRITLIDKSTQNCVYDNKNINEIEGDYYTFKEQTNFKNILNSTYFTYKVASKVYENDIYNSYIRIQVKVSKSFNVNLYLAIFVPISYAIICLIFVLISKYFYKQNLEPLKNQVRKFYKLVTKKDENNVTDDPLSISRSIRNIRKELEISLDQNQKYQSQINFILDSIDQGLIVFNSDNSIIMINNKASQLFNINKEEAINGSFQLLDNLDIYKLIKVCQLTNENHKEYININNRVYDVEVSLLNLNWVKNDIKPGYSIFLIDVTDEYNSRKMKEEFFANVAHEIKSPLTSIIGYQEMIRDKVLTSKKEIKEANEITIKEANRLKTILNNMLGVSSIERNELRPIVKINLKTGINNILDSLKYQLSSSNITVHADIPTYILKMNEQDFDILFRNLIENAIKYNKENGKIFITFNQKNKSITIKDTGIGIDEDNISRIFERFYRIKKARSLKDGTGLGLSLVKHTCKYYNYKITVDSKVKEYTSFTITFD